ncbi:SDR family oxidoreductase [Rathayibacter sp. YIM 133350]|uniref:SDR family oxidoreductase n=1 Tax=Rathayibacter sp. YIM 133350 TaxID=3131992 RepID=UPI00307E082A
MTQNSPTLAITGSTGTLGGMVARALAASGVPQRLIVRSLDRAPVLDDAIAVEADYGDADAAARALEGVETLFMVSATETDHRLDDHLTFVEQAAKAGVHHIVYTSFTGAGPHAAFTLARDHGATEEAIDGLGLAHTFLRDNLYLDFVRHMVGDDGILRGPAGDGRFAGVARADVARSALAVLRDPSSHIGHTYDLTGPEALTMTEVAQILSTALAREISFHDESEDEAYASRARFNAPAWQVQAWVSTYQAIAAGELARVSRDVERLTGRRPLSLAELLASD